MMGKSASVEPAESTEMSDVIVPVLDKLRKALLELEIFLITLIKLIKIPMEYFIQCTSCRWKHLAVQISTKLNTSFF